MTTLRKQAMPFSNQETSVLQMSHVVNHKASVTSMSHWVHVAKAAETNQVVQITCLTATVATYCIAV